MLCKYLFLRKYVVLNIIYFITLITFLSKVFSLVFICSFFLSTNLVIYNANMFLVLASSTMLINIVAAHAFGFFFLQHY